jgi:hypothetical protein
MEAIDPDWRHCDQLMKFFIGCARQQNVVISWSSNLQNNFDFLQLRLQCSEKLLNEHVIGSDYAVSEHSLIEKLQRIAEEFLSEKSKLC